MLDEGSAIRKSYADALEGNITYNAAVIPVVDDKVKMDTKPDLYVRVTSQSATPKNGLHYWANDVDVVLDIINVRENTGNRKWVESIANQIKTIVLPTRNTYGITIAAPFKLIQVKVIADDSDPLTKVEANTYFINKRLVFRNHIIQ